MSRKRQTGRKGGTRAPARSRSRFSARRLWLGIATAAAALLLLWVIADRRAPGRAPTTVEQHADLDPEQAHRRAVALQREKRAHESLPYFRRAAAGLPNDWRVLANYAVALHDATLEARSAGKVSVMATRNSLERAAMMRESLSLLDQAERLAERPEDRAYVIASRAHRLVIWGFARDALVEFRHAAELDPNWGEVAAELERRLEDPTRPDAPR
ncbi:MAG TPA: hypothetical protein VEY91_07215 [Candidatus Limnocylindria bacterium]|nr:hypothetical protein [Candidatus Limnocylindria bacterium]